MAAPRILELSLSNEGQQENWELTTLKDIGKYEDFLEKIIFNNPELVIRTTGQRINESYVVRTQVPICSIQEGTIYPDLLILADNGEVTVVEVKIYGNDEMRNRKVLGQVLEYAVSLSECNEQDIVKILSPQKSNQSGLVEIIKSLFPNENDPDGLANNFVTNIGNGKLNLVIACDKAPQGFKELVHAISRGRSNLDYSMTVVELRPYVRESESFTKILIVPQNVITTEIVARTVVAVSLPDNNKKPLINVQTVDLEEIEQNLDRLQRQGKIWSDQDRRDAFMEWDNPVAKRLVDFIIERTYKGRISAGGVTKQATLGFYFPSMIEKGKSQQLFFLELNNERVHFFINQVRNNVPETISKWFEEQFALLFDIDVADKKEPLVDLKSINDKWSEFEKMIDLFMNKLLGEIFKINS